MLELELTKDLILLKCKSEDFDFNDPLWNALDLAKALVKLMYDKGGIGISAIQCGIPKRVFAIRGDPENIVMFNPLIVNESEETILLDEGCLSYPGLYLKIKRPRHVRVRFSTPNGDRVTKQFTGITARTILHENDHLNGIIFLSKANKFHRDQALRHQKRSNNENGNAIIKRV